MICDVYGCTAESAHRVGPYHLCEAHYTELREVSLKARGTAFFAIKGQHGERMSRHVPDPMAFEESAKRKKG